MSYFFTYKLNMSKVCVIYSYLINNKIHLKKSCSYQNKINGKYGRNLNLGHLRVYILVDVKVSLPCQLVPPKTNLLNALECEPAVGDASGKWWWGGIVRVAIILHPKILHGRRDDAVSILMKWWVVLQALFLRHPNCVSTYSKSLEKQQNLKGQIKKTKKQT